MIWLMVAILMCLFAAAVLLPAGGRQKAASTLDLYISQLQEIDKDIAVGLLSQDEAKAAKLEIEHRILRLETDSSDKKSSVKAGSIFYIILIVSVVISSFGLYSQVGRADLPASPARIVELGNSPIEEGGPTLNNAILMIKERLADEPDDLRGWEVLATSSRAAADFHTAEQAYYELMRLDSSNPKWPLLRLETMLTMTQGQWHPGVRLVLEDFTATHNDHPAAYFYMGQLYKADGNIEETRKVWNALLERFDERSELAQTVRRELASLGPAPQNALPRISREDQEAIASLSEEDQKAFIGNMIIRLANRLNEEPNDSQGWQMLARAYVETGQKHAAIKALEAAIGRVQEQDKPALQSLLDKIRKNQDLR